MGGRMNDTIDKLRRNFATGMTSARISDDEWRDVFLPVIRDAERYAWLRDGNGYFPEENWLTGGEEMDEAIDAAMSATTEESK